MEALDVLNMGNIQNFHVDHSNRYLFYFFKFQDPFIGPKKIIPIMGFMVQLIAKPTLSCYLVV